MENCTRDYHRRQVKNRKFPYHHYHVQQQHMIQILILTNFVFFCNKTLDHRSKQIRHLHLVHIYQKILNHASVLNNEIGEAVLNRLKDNSLEGKNPQYHVNCFRDFFIKESVASEEMPESFNMETESFNIETEACDMDCGRKNDINNKRNNLIENLYNYIEESGQSVSFVRIALCLQKIKSVIEYYMIS